jgi:hypothetical protein
MTRATSMACSNAHASVSTYGRVIVHAQVEQQLSFGSFRDSATKEREMRLRLMMATVFALASSAWAAEEHGRPTAIMVSPIHEAQVVRGDDNMDHVEYELLIVSVFSEPATLSNVTALDSAGTRPSPRSPCGGAPASWSADRPASPNCRPRGQGIAQRLGTQRRGPPRIAELAGAPPPR